MIALSNKEILRGLKEIGIDTKMDQMVSLIKYRSYYFCNNWKCNKKNQGSDS